jgi:hypothetical protein
MMVKHVSPNARTDCKWSFMTLSKRQCPTQLRHSPFRIQRPEPVAQHLIFATAAEQPWKSASRDVFLPGTPFRVVPVPFVALLDDRIETNELLVDFGDALLAKLHRCVIDLTI